MMRRAGAYVLSIVVEQSLRVRVGALGIVTLPAGLYAYVGSARSGIAGRIARHRRLATQKYGKLRWHIDYLLTNPSVQWAGEAILEDGIECKISRRIARMKGVTAPVPGFGSSDCRSGCGAHLYLLPEAFRNVDLARRL
jgi:Uri superfamily endonuclease